MKDIERMKERKKERERKGDEKRKERERYREGDRGENKESRWKNEIVRESKVNDIQWSFNNNKHYFTFEF